MLNQAPVFVNGFQRGGTNILMRLILSHPHMCSLGAELHELFYGRETEPVQKWLRRLTALPVLLNTVQHTFWPYRLQPRRPLAAPTQRYVDMLFYLYKRMGPETHYRNGSEAKTLAEKSRGRITGKCVNGVILTTPLLAAMYPDATFIALVRNGLALCEGFMRRGWGAERCGRMYQQLCDQMIQDARHRTNYHIIRFEDLVRDPAATVQHVYEQIGLDVNRVEKFNLQAKKSMGENGQRSFTFGAQHKISQWCALHELKHHLRQDVNDNQIAHLSPADRGIFLQHAHAAMSTFGYL